MNLTVKLYAMLSDYLPAEARETNEVALTVVEDATAGRYGRILVTAGGVQAAALG